VLINNTLENLPVAILVMTAMTVVYLSISRIGLKKILLKN